MIHTVLFNLIRARIIFLLMFAGLSIANLSAGTVTWDDEAGNQLWSDSQNWDGDVLPAASSDVVIDGSYVVKMDMTTTVNSLAIRNMGIVTIELGFTLFVSGIANQAVSVIGGGLLIEGSLEIDQFIGEGLVNTGGGMVVNDGQILIELVTGDGISNQAIIENKGVILIDSTGRHGLRNWISGIFNNLDSMTIRRTDQFGITNSTTFTNTGVLTLEDITYSTGLGNSGTLTNESQIFVDQVDGNGFSNSGSVNNSGSIKITFCATGVRNSTSAFFDNQSTGVLILSSLINDGIKNEEDFDNSGGIFIDGPFQGILNESHSYFINRDQAEIFINNTSQHAIANYDSLVNRGHININHASTGIFNHTSNTEFINQDSIWITDCSQYGLFNNNSAVFTIRMLGYLSIKQTNLDAILNRNITSQILNNGFITVCTSSGTGIHCQDNVTFTNSATGHVEIIGAAEGSLNVEVPATLESFGTIDMQ